jgi:hypothetical protein
LNLNKPYSPQYVDVLQWITLAACDQLRQQAEKKKKGKITTEKDK